MPNVKRVTAKGKTYLYFDTGTRTALGKPIYVRLPPRSDPSFGSAYAAASAARTKRQNITAVLTVPALINLYERSPEFRKLADSTQRTYGVYLRELEKQLDVTPAAELERRDVYALLDRMGDRSGAANMILCVTRSLYAWARRRDYVAVDPCAGMELREKADYEPWGEDLIVDALASPIELVRVSTALLYFTAQRIGDVCRMRWGDIRADRIVVRQQKTGKELSIPLHADLRAILATLPKRSLSVLTHPDGTPANDNAVRYALQKFASDKGRHVVPHGLRKNAVIALLEAGCSVAETASISGQSLRMVEHYAKQRNQHQLASAAILKWEGAKR